MALKTIIKLYEKYAYKLNNLNDITLRLFELLKEKIMSLAKENMVNVSGTLKMLNSFSLINPLKKYFLCESNK